MTDEEKALHKVARKFNNDVRFAEFIRDGGFKGLYADKGYEWLGSFWDTVQKDTAYWKAEKAREKSGVPKTKAAPASPDNLNAVADEYLVQLAAGFDNWQEFMEYIETVEHERIPAESLTSGAQWYQTFWEKARGIMPDADAALAEVNERRERDQRAEGDPATMDALFMAQMRREGELESFLERIHELNNNPLWQPADEAEQEELERIRGAQGRIRRELRHGSWISNAARIAQGKPLSHKSRTTLLSLMSSASRDYRSLYADIMQDEQWAVSLADTSGAALTTRIADPKRAGEVADMSPEQRRSLAEELDNEDVARELQSGKLKMDDARLRNYIKSLEVDKKASDKKLQALKDEIDEDYRRMSDGLTRQLLKDYEGMLLLKGKLRTREGAAIRMLNRGITVSEKYQRTTNQMRATYNSVWQKISDRMKNAEIIGKAREALARQDAHYEESLKNAQTRQKVNAAREVTELRKRRVKHILRRVDFKTVAHDKARLVIAIQRLFEPNILFNLDEFIGNTERLPREVYSEYKTDSEYRQRLQKSMQYKDGAPSKKWRNLEKIMAKSFDELSEKERDDITRIAGGIDWVREMHLDRMRKERREAVQLGKDTAQDALRDLTFTELDDDLQRHIAEAIPEDLFYTLKDTPFKEWTLNDVEALDAILDKIYHEGKIELAAGGARARWRRPRGNGSEGHIVNERRCKK